MKEWCGEITYMTEDGPIHSDICHHDDGNPISDEDRQFIHDCLDEWLNKSNGTGNFVLNMASVLEGYKLVKDWA